MAADIIPGGRFKMKITIGIDPGQTGAIAIRAAGKITHLFDMPTSARIHGNGQQVDGYTLASMLRGAVAEDAVTVHLEAVHAMPGQGVSSMFRFGESLGVVIGVCGAMQYPLLWITPQRWKKQCGLLRRDKDSARTLAIQRHPEVAGMLARKKDVDRAEAICIAGYHP